MHAIEFTEPQKITIIDRPNEENPAPGEAVVRTHRMGICGTDLSCYLGKFPFFAYPRTPGHELGLEVVAVGEGVTVPARKLHPGNDLSYDQLALVETLAIGYHAVQRGNPKPSETVLVIGAGPIGLACLEFLKLMEGVNVIVMDMVQGRLDFCAKNLGIKNGVLAKTDGSHLADLEKITNGNLCDVIIDATGSPRSMSTCFEFAAFTGRVVYVGITTSDLQFPHAPVFHRRELTLLASRNALPSDFPEIINLIRQGKINTDIWITHRITFDEVPEKFAQFTDPNLGAIKAIIEVR
jgi:alcohol dehydrogenase